jgi:hypothetical protein
MGWWKRDSGEILGDEPADIVAVALEAVSEELLARRGRRLRLDELLGTIHLVLQTNAANLLVPGEAEHASHALTAELELIDEERSVTVEMTAPSDEAVTGQIDRMCARIAAAYSAVLDRHCTLSELFASIDFVLGANPDQLLDVPPHSRVRAITGDPSYRSTPIEVHDEDSQPHGLLDYVRAGRYYDHLRDRVTPEDLPALAAAYPGLDWNQRLALVLMVGDLLSPSTRALMEDFLLHSPDDIDGGDADEARVIAVCHVDGDLDAFDDYYNDLSLVDARRGR